MKTPIPERMAHLKRDARGYPIPHGVVIDREGKPHFAMNDEVTRIRVIRNDLCSICGTKLFRGRWLIGGALAAFHEFGAFIDPPMHSECAHYALQVCPYLAAPRYLKEIGHAKAKANKAALGDNLIMIDNSMFPGRPTGEMFVALMTTKPIQLLAETFNLKPKPPYNVVEYWRHGQRIPNGEGEQLVQFALRDFAA